MSVTLNEPALRIFLESTEGPVGRDAERRAQNVAIQAFENATGPIIGIDTGDLLGGIRVSVGANATGIFAAVSTDARHRGFAYPSFHDQNGRPWLTQALRDAFDTPSVL